MAFARKLLRILVFLWIIKITWLQEFLNFNGFQYFPAIFVFWCHSKLHGWMFGYLLVAIDFVLFFFLQAGVVRYLLPVTLIVLLLFLPVRRIFLNLLRC